MSTSTLQDPAPTAETPASTQAIPASLTRRILRRETHSSRSGATVVVLVLLLLVAAYVGVEAVYAGLGLAPLLFSPSDVLSSLLDAATTQGGLVIAAGLGAVVLGIVLFVIALTPGRRGRHTIDDDRVAVVVDDQVVAASLARRARIAASLAPGQVTAWVAKSSARITITPASGATADLESVQAAAREELRTVGYRPAVTPDVRINRNGRLGA